jgi:ribosome-associated protein
LPLWAKINHPGVPRKTAGFVGWLVHSSEFIVKKEIFMAELQDKIASVAQAALDSKNGQNISAIHVAKQTVLADWFVLATGTSNTHINTLADEVEFKVKEELGIDPIRTEGRGNNMWILVDYGSVIVHVFTKEGREFYKLDKLWNA